MILAAIRSGLDILSGLHTFLGDDPEFADAARSAGVRLVDYRRPPERMETAVGRRHAAGQARDPHRRARTAPSARCRSPWSCGARRSRPGRSASFVPTGQTGMMIEGWGVAVDRVIADFVQGTAEWLVEEGERRGDWVIVEGQGALDHPAYSSVTLGLIHGTTPHAMVLVHKPGMADHDFDHLPDRRLPDRAAAAASSASTRRSPALVAPSKVVAVAAQHVAHPGRGRGAPDHRGDRRRDRPADAPTRSASAATRLWREIEAAVDALPWVEPAPRTGGEPA